VIRCRLAPTNARTVGVSGSDTIVAALKDLANPCPLTAKHGKECAGIQWNPLSKQCSLKGEASTAAKFNFDLNFSSSVFLIKDRDCQSNSLWGEYLTRSSACRDAPTYPDLVPLAQLLPRATTVAATTRPRSRPHYHHCGRTRFIMTTSSLVHSCYHALSILGHNRIVHRASSMAILFTIMSQRRTAVPCR
jgi:hypothetical protein